jgi:hypothetical protein
MSKPFFFPRSVVPVVLSLAAVSSPGCGSLSDGEEPVATQSEQLRIEPRLFVFRDVFLKNGSGYYLRTITADADAGVGAPDRWTLTITGDLAPKSQPTTCMTVFGLGAASPTLGFAPCDSRRVDQDFGRVGDRIVAPGGHCVSLSYRWQDAVLAPCADVPAQRWATES